MLILGSLAQSGVFSAIVDHSGLPMLILGLHGNSGLLFWASCLSWASVAHSGGYFSLSMSFRTPPCSF